VKWSAAQSFRLTAGPVVVLLWADAVQAQRVPIEAVWAAGFGLIAPFVAVPIKVGILRVFKVDAANVRLWLLGLIEWVLWFPVAFVLLQLSDANLLPVVIPILLVVSAWLHRSWIAKASWTIAIFLCLITPVLIVGLPSLAFVTMAYVQSGAA
jgi:hypothetical protein